MSGVRCQVIRCPVTGVICHVSRVYFFYNVMELVCEGSVINRAQTIDSYKPNIGVKR